MNKPTDKPAAPGSHLARLVARQPRRGRLMPYNYSSLFRRASLTVLTSPFLPLPVSTPEAAISSAPDVLIPKST